MSPARLLAQTTQFVSLDVIAFHRSADVLLVLVIGGVGSSTRADRRHRCSRFLQDILASITPQYWTFWIGLVLVVLVLAGRDRVTARVVALWRRVFRRESLPPWGQAAEEA